MKKGPESKSCPVSCSIYVDKYKMKKLPTLLHFGKSTNIKLVIHNLTFKRRIKSHLPFAGIIRSSAYSPHFQDNG
jgi:hypothetical protein